MIPAFPKFKKLDLVDRAHIEIHTNQHHPYSDFNFTNLWAWDVTGGRMISELNGNLVVLFTDYGTCEPVLSFLGTRESLSTARMLIEYSKETKVNSILCFVSEESAKGINDPNLHVEEDEHNFDYIFSVEKLANPQGKKLKQKRRLAKKFMADYPEATFEIRDFKDKNSHKQILSTLRRWENKKINDKKQYDLVYEEIALKRLLDTAGHHNLILSGIFIQEEMIAFSIDEILPNKYAISHFIKADYNFKGIYEYMNMRISQHLLEHKVEYWNWEQDLNIEGLRKVKQSFRPVKYLRKYKVSFAKK